LTIGELTNVINKCPATRLAANRTDKVIGRITLLTNSIKTIKGIKTYGVPTGTKWAKKLPIFIEILKIIYPIHIVKANLTEKDKCLVAVKVYGVKPAKLFSKIIKNKAIAQ
jgi:hypothetical protein